MAKRAEFDPAWIELIVDSLSGIRYGSVQFVIHDGRIVQIDRTEKRRFEGANSVKTVDFPQKNA